jgi:hypothetical protein
MTKSGRQQHTYEIYVKRSSRTRVRQQSKLKIAYCGNPFPAARCSGRFSREIAIGARAVIFMKTIVDPYRNGQAQKSESESRENCRLFNFRLHR